MRRRSALLPVLALVLLCSIAPLSTLACSLPQPFGSVRQEAKASQPEPTRPSVASPTAPALRTEPTAKAEPALPPAPTLAPVVAERREPAQPAAAVQGGPLNVVHVAARVRPAVAQIMVKGTAPSFFEAVPTSGVGSGAIIDRKGYIITNNHVVEDANEMIVTLPDRDKSYNARLVGRDPSTDLAVVRIEGDDLPLVTLGDSDALQVGEPVVAIGNALGLEGGPTVTAGVVSALNRSIDEPNGATLHQLIQTDAAINPGNSGGPLVNSYAQVIGVNTAVATGSGEAPAQGIGFAISINSAKPIIDDLITYGKVRRPYLGIELATVTPALARQYRLPVDRGVYIVRAVKGGPAAKAGMEAGDIIVKIESDEIRKDADLRNSLSKLKIGQKVRIEASRAGNRRTFDVTLLESPAP